MEAQSDVVSDFWQFAADKIAEFPLDEENNSEEWEEAINEILNWCKGVQQLIEEENKKKLDFPSLVCYIQGMVRAIHFVGFKGEEFFSAVRVWGLPDFVHRWKDDRFKHGGEVHPNDLVVFANGEETKVRKYTFNDSEGL